MKISFPLALVLIITILAGCSSKQTKNDNQSIIGIWQNSTNPKAAIEFTKEGNYYLRIDGERILSDDSTTDKYAYNALSKENNLKIFNSLKVGNTEGKLVILSSERIKISLVNQGTIVSEAEFTKVSKH